MTEYDLLLKNVQVIIQDNVYVEDEMLYIKSKCKYDLINLMSELDSKFMKDLYSKLEYEEREE